MRVVPHPCAHPPAFLEQWLCARHAGVFHFVHSWPSLKPGSLKQLPGSKCPALHHLHCALAVSYKSSLPPLLACHCMRLPSPASFLTCPAICLWPPALNKPHLCCGEFLSPSCPAPSSCSPPTQNTHTLRPLQPSVINTPAAQHKWRAVPVGSSDAIMNVTRCVGHAKRGHNNDL